MKENEFVIYKTWKSEYKLVIGMLLGMFLSVFLSSKFPQTVVVVNLFNIGSESVNLYLPVGSFFMRLLEFIMLSIA